MLLQLVYVSNRKSNCPQEEIDKILNSCEENNPRLNVTGVLLYTDQKFIQLVEGDARVITDLYDKIKDDSRHSNTMMISLGPIKEKSIPCWNMASRSISGSRFDYISTITDTDKIVFDKILNGESENGERVLDILKKFF